MEGLTLVQVVAASGVGSGVTVWGVLRFILGNMQRQIDYNRRRLDRHIENH